MQQEQRRRVGADAGHMQVVEIDTLERDAELRKGIKRGFLGAPVKIVAPILRKLPKISDVSAVVPCATGRLVGKARARETVAQVRNVGVRDMKSEWGGCDGHDAARPVGQATQLLGTVSPRPAAASVVEGLRVTLRAASAPCADTSRCRPLPALDLFPHEGRE